MNTREGSARAAGATARRRRTINAKAGFAILAAHDATNHHARESNNKRRGFSMARYIIHSKRAPAVIGPYSQAVRAGNTVYLSGQIPLEPETGDLISGDIRAQAQRVFDNLAAVAEAAGGSIDDVAKLNIFLTDLSNFPLVNEVMAEVFSEPYPARAAIGVAALPKGAEVEMDAVMVLSD
jgi:reactive intermediate/imine deaminase